MTRLQRGIPAVSERRPLRRDPVEQALAALRQGDPVIVTDDEDRENEGDLILAAQFATPERVAFLLRHTSGVLCVALPGDRCDELGLVPMTTDPTDPLGTAFTVSVDAVTGTSTGISAADRALTLRALADPTTSAADLSRPGHVFPLRARPAGVLERRGHTEAGVDLMIAAGLRPAAVLSEIVTHDHGGMAGTPELLTLADHHGLVVISVDQIIAHRRRHRPHVRKVSEAVIPTPWGRFATSVYVDGTGTEHLCCVPQGGAPSDPQVGDPGVARGAALVRIHSECLTGDVLGSARCDCGDQLRAGLARIAQHGHGALVYLRGQEGRGIGLGAKLQAYNLQDAGFDTVDANLELGLPVDGRAYHVAAAILRDTGIVGPIRLLTNNPAKTEQLAAAGLDVQRVGLECTPTADNIDYLRTKRDRLGHELALPDGALIGDTPAIGLGVAVSAATYLQS